MKIKRLERMRDSQLAYHRKCQWVMEDGIYAPHSYAGTQPDALSWWDDVGLILGDRRVMVWWIHPRQRYADEIEEQARLEAGEPPREGGLFGNAKPNYKCVGRSRKKIVSYTTQPTQGELRQYYDRLGQTIKRLQHDGIDFDVKLSWHRERLPWATGISLVAPLEVRSEEELKSVADLARQLLRNQTTLEQEFPDYRYGKDQWLAERAELDLANGDRYEVLRVNETSVTIGLDGRAITLPADQPLHIDHAYATTAHSAQGLTCDRVFYNAESTSRTTAQDTYYVSISRERHDVVVFTDNALKLPDAVARVPYKGLAHDLVQSDFNVEKQHDFIRPHRAAEIGMA